jgi:hypothetical protein
MSVLKRTHDIGGLFKEDIMPLIEGFWEQTGLAQYLDHRETKWEETGGSE